MRDADDSTDDLVDGALRHFMPTQMAFVPEIYQKQRLGRVVQTVNTQWHKCHVARACLAERQQRSFFIKSSLRIERLVQHGSRTARVVYVQQFPNRTE